MQGPGVHIFIMKLHKHDSFTGIEPKTMDHTPLSYCVLFLVEHNSGKKMLTPGPILEYTLAFFSFWHAFSGFQ